MGARLTFPRRAGRNAPQLQPDPPDSLGSGRSGSVLAGGDGDVPALGRRSAASSNPFAPGLQVVHRASEHLAPLLSITKHVEARTPRRQQN